MTQEGMHTTAIQHYPCLKCPWLIKELYKFGTQPCTSAIFWCSHPDKDAQITSKQMLSSCDNCPLEEH